MANRTVTFTDFGEWSIHPKMFTAKNVNERLIQWITVCPPYACSPPPPSALFPPPPMPALALSVYSPPLASALAP